MNRISFKPVSFLLGLVALTVVGNAMSARAETPNTNLAVSRSEAAPAPVRVVERSVPSAALVDPLASNSTASVSFSEAAPAPVRVVERSVPSAAPVDPLANHPTDKQISKDTSDRANGQKADLEDINSADSQIRQSDAMLRNNQQTASDAVNGVTVSKPPTPGTLATSASLLNVPPETSPRFDMPSDRANSTVAQNETEIRPGQATRGGSSYIGIGGNIGFTGETAVGNGAFVVNSKIGLTRSISVRPSVVISDDVDFLIPVTYDFVIESADPFAPVPFAPFVGGGVAFSTNDGDDDNNSANDDDDNGNNFGFLITGGVDVPLSREFVANATLNVAFIEDTTDVGIVIGVGYTFPNFRR